MKRTIFTLVALSMFGMAMAQSAKPGKPAADAVLISQTQNGNTVISRYRVPQKNNSHADFDVHYAVNRSDISASFADNTEQIDSLNKFMSRTADTMMHIGHIAVHGYASPDGNAKQNDSLAAQRAAKLCHYATQLCNCCPATKVATTSRTYTWREVAPVVEKIDMPSKSEVLRILRSSASEPDKERQLRRYPAAWRYLANNVLPQMRYADIEFDYGVDKVVTTTFVSQPAPQPAPQPQPDVVVVDEETGIIIASPRDIRRAERKINKAERRANRQ